MEIPQITFNEFKVWTDDFIIPKSINLKSIINPSTSQLFLIEIRIQEFVQYLSKKGDSIVEEPRGPFITESYYLPSNAMIRDNAAPDDSLCEILSSIGVPLHRMLPIITKLSAFARTMMSLPANLGRPLLPIVLGIAINSWDPRGSTITHERIKHERVCLTPFLGIRYKVEA
ncbi:hypothetical protein KY285_019076 [Solanum tuberosum]|uniref:Uncharacterized protein n=1 Tax=Solanum tuberosum TaxID=4113 RepID=M1CPN9_SOLTU|nr:hypothetical protein KY284_016771 [Solanum tuberosum]KAH0689629.1 hypothetical protein KY289_016987 [Solanum tuberosum]KAH0704798.1 hypothetical protein KY285_019076 [Solanum tuberosum]